MLERTRTQSGRRVHSNWGWQQLVVFIGGLGWWASLIGYVAWSLLRVISLEDGCADTYFGGRLSIVTGYLRPFPVELDQFVALEQVPKASLWLGLASFWWNNRVMRKVNNSRARLTGASEYYQLQAIVFIVRVAAWWTLREDEAWIAGRAAQRGAHLFTLGFIFVVCPSFKERAYRD